MFEISKLTRDEIFRYRVLLTFGVLVYPLWGLVEYFYLPEFSGEKWLWVLATTIPLGLLMGSFFVKEPLPFLEKSLVLGGYVLLLHSNLVIIESHVHPMLFCGYLILTSTLINIFPSKRSSVFVGISAMIFAVGLILTPGDWQLSPFFIAFAILSTVLPSLFANFTRLNHLRALQKVHLQQSVLFSTLEEGLIVYDPQGRIELTNPAAIRIMGLDSQQVPGSEIYANGLRFFSADGSFLPGDQLPSIVARTTRKPVRHQIIGFQRPDGQLVWTHCSAIPYFFQSAKPRVVVTFTDVTELKKSNQLVSQQQTQLFSSAKLRALGEMAAGVAHEINTPLAIINGKAAEITRTLKMGAPLESIAPNVEKISSTIWRIQKIIKGLQTFSRGGEKDPYLPNSLLKMTEEILAFCNERIQMRAIKVHLEIPASIRFDCRAVQISQVLLNLVQNASDAIVHQQEKWIRIQAQVEGPLVRIWVSDSGPGVPQGLEDKIMEPFFTTKDVGQGTGLGLSISKGLIEGHNGRFELIQNSNPTTFLIELPVQQVNVPRAA